MHYLDINKLKKFFLHLQLLIYRFTGHYVYEIFSELTRMNFILKYSTQNLFVIKTKKFSLIHIYALLTNKIYTNCKCSFYLQMQRVNIQFLFQKILVYDCACMLCVCGICNAVIAYITQCIN